MGISQKGLVYYSSRFVIRSKQTSGAKFAQKDDTNNW